MAKNDVSYTRLAIIALMRAHMEIYGFPYGKQRHRIPVKVINALPLEYRNLFKIGRLGKSWLGLNSAFRSRKVQDAEKSNGLKDFYLQNKDIVDMSQKQYNAFVKTLLAQTSRRKKQTVVKDAIKLKDVFELVAFTIIDNHVENPEFDIKDFLKNAAQKRLKWPENKTGLRLPYIWQEIVDLAQSEKIEGLGQDFDIVVFAEKIAERLYPQDNREKVLDCPTPQEVQQWMIAEAPSARAS